MRPLVSRGLLLPPLLCSALLFVPVGTAAAVSDIHAETADRTTVAWSAPAAEAIAGRLDVLERADHEDVFAPLVDAVNSIALTEDGRLDPAEATRYAESVRAAHATVQQRLIAAGLPETAPESRAAADPVSDLLASLQKAVEGLLGSLTKLDLGGVLGAVTGLLTPVLGLVTGLLGGGLPKLPAELPADLPADLPAAGAPAG
ncbi:hypothetical protein [Streptomyces lincolnensis]|uniref:hypothetical protein n=1 Tax=Streptomyces lincolnensis TaxID=1915 RepID=UPI000829560A|nr:hypothetical protein [Streptomyces lincolnensis]QMV11315.1 hypothetical protein GJU35_40325 [Streptomyces lincolnensis]